MTQLSGLFAKGRGESRAQKLQEFAQIIKGINKSVDMKVSSRGWCYLLEGKNYITKGDFDKAQSTINECRKRGFLPIDFVAQDESRSFDGVEHPNTEDPISYFKNLLKAVLQNEDLYTPNWWDGEEYYIQLLVEKIDLKNLFEPICQEYHIPIATGRGWSDILQRAEMAQRFKQAEYKNLKPVLLYCGDFDPYGLAISEFLMKNLMDIMGGTRWSPLGLEVDRFGLNFDFIESNNLTWIDNLESGSGKNMVLLENRIVQDYIAEYGERKCEANALVVVPDAARDLCRDAIEEWLGNDALDRFEAKRETVRKTLQEFKERTGAQAIFDKILGQD
ncbi:MAG: hypothetical protein AAB922_00480 [Patescibacteria group bacterium]